MDAHGYDMEQTYKKGSEIMLCQIRINGGTE